MKISKIAVTGQKELIPVDPTPTDSLVLEESIIIDFANRDGNAEKHILQLNEDKVAEFEFEDGTVWLCDESSLHDLFPGTEDVNRSGDVFELPSTLKNTNNERGIIGDIAIRVVRIFSKKIVDGKVAALAKKLEDQQLNGKEGLFQLANDFSLLPFNSKASKNNYCLFIHGTNSSTAGAYGELRGSATWSFIQENYGQNVIAYNHRTLTQSPLQNALALATALPDGANLHVISHSRGGIVGDILCRYGDGVGFSQANIDLLKKEGDRDNDIDCIKKLDTLFKKKKLSVKKFVRVACPAAGTKLASKKLEQLFNIFFNLLGANTNPVAGGFKELIAEILKTKDDVNVLPGIEAQSPDSPFIRILNDRTEEATLNDQSLAVISGNSQASLSLKGLGVIVTKLFFWQRNDMVVNTDSMYLGSSRKDNIQYFFDQGPQVTHVTYFDPKNKTCEALLQALKTPDGINIPGFASVPQMQIPASDRGLEHGELFSNPPSGKKPIVIMLPGIMGSNLRRDGDRIWINYWQFLKGGLLALEDVNDQTISASSLVRTSYGKLADRLSFTYDVVVFPFDWRKQMNECAAELNEKIIELMKLDQPIKVIGHSMGGVLFRDFIVTHNNTWQQLNASKDFRLLFLGSPLGGSFRIPAVLFGNDGIINTLSAVDLRHTKKQLLGMFSKFPGILSLLPLTTGEGKDFANEETWRKMCDAFGDSDWPIPANNILKEFGAYRDGIIAANDSIDYSNMVYIAGKDKATACDYYNDLIPPRKELVFLYTEEGDQSVTWESGIPQKLIDSKAVYYVDVTHGALANEPGIFDGIEEILEKGTTDELSIVRPAKRSTESKFRMDVDYNFDLSDTGVENAILGLTQKSTPIAGRIPLLVSVSNGDLCYSSYPLIAGHFKNDGILYAEKSIDWKLGNRLTSKHSLEIYPGDVGSNDIFMNTAGDDFKGAIIIGLGEAGSLTGFMLTKTVEQGVINYLLSMDADAAVNMEDIGISSLMIACGYGGLAIETSIKAIIEGVNNANVKVAALLKNDSRTVKFIEFVELYEDRALSCMYALSKIQDKENQFFNIKIANRKIRNLFGLKMRLPVESDASWWNRISVIHKEIKDDTGMVSQSLVFGASSGDARVEERELFSSTALIDLFIEQMSTRNNWDGCSAKTIFELMIPNEIKDRLKRKGNISWILDKNAAAYPWELLQDSSINTKPLCIDAGMIRQLSTGNFRINVVRATKDKALIVGDPILKGMPNINQLPGAEREAKAVETVMNSRRYSCNSVISKSATEVVKNLFCDNYRIIHLAGHGVFTPNDPKRSGMVIGPGIFLTTSDIGQMSTVPELVFVNCCHLGKVSAADEKYYQDRYKLAANIGTQLIEMGVKAVIAAGWAVNDLAAADFANAFYEKMFEGCNFGEAVTTARNFIYEKYHEVNNTWGAYQCYGDPFFKLVKEFSGSRKSESEYLIAKEAEVDLNNFISDLDTVTTNIKDLLDRVDNICKKIKKAEIIDPAIAEKQALIYAELGEYETAVEKFEKLFMMEKAEFSVSALEKYCSIRTRLYVINAAGPAKQKGKNWEAAINEVIKQVEYLLLISPTAERYYLLGSAYKRKALISKAAQRPAILKTAAFYYYMATKKTDKPYVYAQTNWYEMEAIIRFNAKKPWKEKEVVAVDKKIFVAPMDKDLRKSYTLVSKTDALKNLERLQKEYKKPVGNMDYWQLVDSINIMLCSLVVSDEKKKESWEELLNEYSRVWKNSGSVAKRKVEVEHTGAMQKILEQNPVLKSNLTFFGAALKKIAKLD